MKNLFKKEQLAQEAGPSIAGIERLARLIAAQKALESLIATEEQLVKAEAVKRFVELKCKESFDIFEGSAKGNIQLRKRQSRSKLTDDEANALKDKGISTERVVTQPETFVINPKYANNKKILSQVSRLLNKLVPDDFILYQPEISHMAPSEGAIEQALESAPELVSIVGTIAVRTSYDDTQGAIAEAIESLL